MATKTRPNGTRSVVVRIRVPSRADEDLANDAEERLGRGPGITDVTVDGIRDLSPGLSATVVTISVRLQLMRSELELTEQLAEVPGFESIEKVE